MYAHGQYGASATEPMNTKKKHGKPAIATPPIPPIITTTIPAVTRRRRNKNKHFDELKVVVTVYLSLVGRRQRRLKQRHR